MKPVGLDDPRTGRWPYAVVQLRQDNALGTLWNMVGFQTKLKHAEQVRLFRTIPGLEQAEFARLGGLHRNTFINAPQLLDATLRLKSAPHIRFAGQITGCEGYVEIGRDRPARRPLRRRRADAARRSPRPPRPPRSARCSATSPAAPRRETYQPMNVNFGLFPPIEGRAKKADRKKALHRAGRSGPAGLAGRALIQSCRRSSPAPPRCAQLQRAWRAVRRCDAARWRRTRRGSARRRDRRRRSRIAAASAPPIPRTTAGHHGWCRAGQRRAAAAVGELGRA